jgi:iron-sulfur cluster assembly protein
MSQSPQIISATDRALLRIHELAASEAGDGVRLAVKGGGCSGLSYIIEFGDRRDGDHVLNIDEVTFFVDRKSGIYLKGVQLDFDAGLDGKGFVFANPNASNTCGCGESFSI